MLSKVGTKLKNIVCIAFVIFMAFGQNAVAHGAEQSDSKPVNAKAYEYYYSQLNEQEKAYYKILLENADRMKSGTSKIDITSIATQKQWGALIAKGSWDHNSKVSISIHTAESAFLYDHPELFYIDSNKLSCEIVENGTFSTCIEPESNGKKYLNTGLNSSKDVDACSLKLEKEVNEIVIHAKKQKTTYEQIRYVHDSLINHITYDKSDKKNFVHTAYGLISGDAVCDGYSSAFKLIMDDLGVPCVTVCGDTIKSDTKLHGAKWVEEHKDDEGHAWNYVQLNGKWYDVDVTWDDADSSGESDENKYVYFLTGTKNFGHEEYEMSSFGDGCRFLKYPQLSAEDPKERAADTKVNSIGTQTNSRVAQSGEDTNAEGSGVTYTIISIIGVTWPILIPVLVFTIIHHRNKKEQSDNEEQ